MAAERTRRRVLTALGLAVLALIHAGLAADTARRKSPTIDEIAHLPAGLSYLHEGSFRVYRLSPPLARVIQALPVAGMELEEDYEGAWLAPEPVNHWLFSREFQAANASTPEQRQRYLRAFTRARWAVVVWSALTIPLLFLWGRWWFGERAGWVAAALWAFSPNILAAAGLATTDLPATSAILACTLAFCWWLRSPSWPRAALAGTLLGLAQLTKFSALGVAGILVVWAVVHAVTLRWRWPLDTPSGAPRSRWWPAAWGQLALIVVLCGLVINMGYGWEGTGRPLGSFEFMGDNLTRPRAEGDSSPPVTLHELYNEALSRRINRFRGRPLGRVPVPLPDHYVAGFDEQSFEAEGMYGAYLRGEVKPRAVGAEVAEWGETPVPMRWRTYYLYGLAIKVPLSTWLLLLAGLVLAGLSWRSRWRAVLPLLLLAAGPLAAISLATNLQLGVRYVLPSMPFLFLVAGSAARPAAALVTRWPRWRWLPWLAALALAWNVVSTARIHPHELAYFNELAGGPEGGRFHLMDSNLDWGQDLRGLARWLEQNEDWAEEVRVGYWGALPVEFEEIVRPAPAAPVAVPVSEAPPNPYGRGPMPGKFAVSATLERGIVSPGGVSYTYFQQYEPRFERQIGYSILLYDVTLEDANAARDALGLPRLHRP